MTFRLLAFAPSAIVPEYRKRYLEMARLGAEVTLVVPEWWTQFHRRIEFAPDPGSAHPGLRVVPIRPSGLWLPTTPLRNVFHAYPGVASLMRRTRPSGVEVWGEPFFRASAQVLDLTRAAAPEAAFACYSAQNLLKHRSWPLSAWEKRVLAAADLMFPVSETVAGVLRRKGFAGLLRVAPLGIDPEVFRPRTGPRPSGPLRLVVVGKLESQKGVDLVLTAMARVREARLEVIGTGPARAFLASLARDLGLGDRVAFSGSVPPGEMPGRLRAADVLVQASRTLPDLKEQFGRAVVEAMATGLAVVVSDSGELPQVVGKAGIVFPEGDAEALAAHLARLDARPDELVRLGCEARALAASRYAWARIAREQLEAWDQAREARSRCGTGPASSPTTR